MNIIRKILLEEVEKTKWEYQEREIDGPIYYKRLKGESTWFFTDEVDFYRNSNKSNRVKWVQKKT